MENRQIEIVLSVAKHMSFSEAAWDTSVSLSTVSKQISALESELGVRLFFRNAKSRVSLTPEGEALLPRFQEMQDLYEKVLLEVRRLGSGDNADVVVGMPNGWSTLGEDELITKFNLEYPDINPKSYMSGNTQELRCELIEGNVDAFFTMMAPEQVCHMMSNLDIGLMELETLHLHIGVPTGHEAIRDGVVALEDLKEETFLFKESCHVKRESDPKIKHFLMACEDIGFEPDMRFIDSRIQMALSAVAAGHVVIPMMYKPAMTYPGVCVLPAKGDPYQFKKVLCYRKDNKSKALSCFKQFIRAEYHIE